jgi:hypothetical protein
MAVWLTTLQTVRHSISKMYYSIPLIAICVAAAINGVTAKEHFYVDGNIAMTHDNKLVLNSTRDSKKSDLSGTRTGHGVANFKEISSPARTSGYNISDADFIFEFGGTPHQLDWISFNGSGSVDTSTGFRKFRVNQTATRGRDSNFKVSGGVLDDDNSFNHSEPVNRAVADVFQLIEKNYN